MTIFKYIDDKDVFQKFYSKNLANRLVRQRSASDEAEASMISKLKEVCGVDYTIRLQKMVQGEFYRGRSSSSVLTLGASQT